MHGCSSHLNGQMDLEYASCPHNIHRNIRDFFRFFLWRHCNDVTVMMSFYTIRTVKIKLYWGSQSSRAFNQKNIWTRVPNHFQSCKWVRYRKTIKIYRPATWLILTITVRTHPIATLHVPLLLKFSHQLRIRIFTISNFEIIFVLIFLEVRFWTLVTL